MEQEEEGKLFFFVFSDQKRVYYFDPVLNTSIINVVEGFNNITSIAADKERGYLFVADYTKANDKSVVMKYHVAVNFTNKREPKIEIKKENIYQVYEGGFVSALSVDHDDHILFIADQTNQKIIQINFKNESMPLGQTSVLYTNINSIKNIYGLASDDDHENLFWSNYAEGSTLGGVLQASYNGKVGTLQELNKLESVTAIAFEDD